MKISTGLFLILHLCITLALVESNKSAGLEISGKRLKDENVEKKTPTREGNKKDHFQGSNVKNVNKNHNMSHLPFVSPGKKTPCWGISCLKSSENVGGKKHRLQRTPVRRRRTESVFLANALDSLDHSKPRPLWQYNTRGEPDKPYKQFTNGTAKSYHNSNNTTAKMMNKPLRNQPGDKRQQWSDKESEMRPRFFFNSAPAEFVEQKPPTLHRQGEGVMHVTFPPRRGRLRGPHHSQGLGRAFHGGRNHMHMINNARGVSRMAMNFFAHPLAQLIPGPLNFHGHLHHGHHSPPTISYAIHINAPPRIEPPPTNVLPRPLHTVDGPPTIPVDMIGGQIPPISPPLIRPPDEPIQPNPSITAQAIPPNFSVMPPPDIPISSSPPIDTQRRPPLVHLPPAPMPPPDISIPSPPNVIQGMPPPIDLPGPPVPPPPAIERVPFPVAIPSPPKVERVPYPVPVPGPPTVQQVMVPVPSPPKIHEVPVPVPSPPEIKKVPVPYPVQVPSPPQIQKVPYPVPFPVKEPPQIQKLLLPIPVPQPAQVRSVPFPVYVRYPPEVRPVPYPVPSPAKPYPVAVPSPPRLMIHQVPYPVMYPQKVPFPIPLVVHHQSISHGDNYGEESAINGQCLVNLCRNGGTCSAYMNTYRCHCANDYQGKHCEEQNMCKPNPCNNFGVCSQVERDYECTCTKGFIGKNCDKPDPCIPSPCENGATCSSDGNSYDCTCRIGWMGKNCQVESKCLPLNPCQNGGTCTEAQGSYKCDCTPGWTGLSCEVTAPETLHQPVLCDNCNPSDGLLGQIKRNELRRRITNFKKGNVIERYQQRTKQRT